MVERGQVWTLLRGGRQYRVLVISNNEFNAIEKIAIWALTIVREVPQVHDLVVPLKRGDPLSGAHVRIPNVIQIVDRSSLRDCHGFVSHATMNAVEDAVRELLELP